MSLFRCTKIDASHNEHMQYEMTANDVDAAFDAIFADNAFDAAEVTDSFARIGVRVEEAAEKHFEASQPGDDDWSMV